MPQSSLQKKNAERRAYYELLYETGAAQTDAANLTAENIDSENGILVYRRKKLGPLSEPCRLTIGKKLQSLLTTLPSSGDLFPNTKHTSANHRSAEFRRRCRVAGITGVSLHSYRHAWAERAKACGYPQRFAQEALGHNSRAVHEAYAKGALVILPALDENKRKQPRFSTSILPAEIYAVLALHDLLRRCVAA